MTYDDFRRTTYAQFSASPPAVVHDHAALRIADGQLVNLADGCRYLGPRGEQWFFAGVRYAVGGAVVRDTAFQANGVVRISKGWLGDAHRPFALRDFAHEYGHYLQQRDLGWWGYYTRVALDSVTHMGPDHYDRPYEQDATLRGAAYLAEHLQQGR